MQGNSIYHLGDLLGGDVRRADAALDTLRMDKSRWLRALHGGRCFAAVEFIVNRGASTHMAYD